MPSNALTGPAMIRWTQIGNKDDGAEERWTAARTVSPQQPAEHEADGDDEVRAEGQRQPGQDTGGDPPVPPRPTAPSRLARKREHRAHSVRASPPFQAIAVRATGVIT